MERSFAVIFLLGSSIFVFNLYENFAKRNKLQEIEIKVNVLHPNGSYVPLPQNPSYNLEIKNNAQSFFEVKCKSRSPVHIKFDGLLANPVQTVDSYRIENKANSLNDYSYEVKAVFQTKKEVTGRYSCLDYDMKNRSSAYIYAYDEYQPKLLHVGVGKPLYGKVVGTQAILPCLSSRLNSSINLFQGEKDLTNDSRVTFDPTVGFSFDILAFKNPFQNYTCVEDLKSWTTFNISVILRASTDNSSNKLIKFKTVKRYDNSIEYRCIGATFMSFVKCQSPMECEFLRSCGSVPKRPHCEVADDYCSNHEADCRSVTLNDFHGMIFCSNDFDSISRGIFADLSGESFISNSIDSGFDDKSLKDKLLIDSIPALYNTWENVEEFKHQESDVFRCNVSKLIGSDGIKWEFELTDGKTIPAKVINETTYSDKTHYSKTSRIVFNNMEIVKLICLAPKMNSDEWLSISHKIFMEESHLPILDGKTHEEVNFPLSLTNPTITCGARGQSLVWSWYKNGQPISDSYRQMINATMSNYLSSTITLFYLRDLNSLNPFTQVYSCTASNFLGSVTKNITVNWLPENNQIVFRNLKIKAF